MERDGAIGGVDYGLLSLTFLWDVLVTHESVTVELVLISQALPEPEE